VEELKLLHASGEAERFYRDLEVPALIGMEAMGTHFGLSGWLRSWAPVVDWRRGPDSSQLCSPSEDGPADAGHILQLLIEKRFPRIWVPSRLERDQRQLLLHRHRLVSMRTG